VTYHFDVKIITFENKEASMAYSEDILKLRARFADAVRYGVVSEDGSNTFEAVLLQIMNDAEKNRQNCVSQAENLRKQAAVLDGQAGGFASVAGIMYNVLNGYVNLAEREAEEEARRAAEENERLSQSEVSTVVDEASVSEELLVEETLKKKPTKKK
jgi:hypothetical protein